MLTSSFLAPADPKANYLAHKEEIDQAIRRVLDSGWYILGQEGKAFEQEFADYLGVSHGVGVGNGTDALEVALRACGVGAGDAVITVSHTVVATVAAIELVGAMPVLVDIEPKTFTLDPSRLEDTIKQHQGSRIKAIIPVHLYGHPADMPAIMEIARRHDLYVIEDCAQSHGAAIKGRKTGAWGDLAAFSFYPTKNLGALGDGGAVVTNNAELGQKLRLIREYGWQRRYISEMPGMNTRLDEIQAAVLRVKLQYLAQENNQRRQLGQVYNSCLADTPLVLPEVSDDVESVYHQYVVKSAQRDNLRDFLKDHAVGTLIHYPVPVHRQPAYQERVAIGSGGLPETEKAVGEILSLPMYPQMINAQAQQVADLIVHWCE
ncbi:MAG: DegT/DnrJ/EryC1/StrS family aminotransferase [Coleofasciculaceae cyanobacterium]